MAGKAGREGTAWGGSGGGLARQRGGDKQRKGEAAVGRWVDEKVARCPFFLLSSSTCSGREARAGAGAWGSWQVG